MKSRRATGKGWSPTIRRRGGSWQVDCAHAFGTRRRKSFKTESEAKEWADAQRQDYATQQQLERTVERNRAVRLTNLPDVRRAEVLQAFELLGNKGNLVDAVRFYLRHHRPAGSDLSVAELYSRLIKNMEEGNRRGKSLRNTRNCLKYFVADLGDRPAHSITTEDVRNFLLRFNTHPSTFNTYRERVQRLFNFGIKLKVVDENPVRQIDKALEDQSEPAIFNSSEARALLANAQKLHPEMVPYLALGLFAGIRPDNELPSLNWTDIDLRRKQIKVASVSSKGRRYRYVKIPDNLRAWLVPHKQTEGAIYFSPKKRRAIAKAAGLSWEQDVMRHSYASHHIAVHNNANLTQRQMGQKSTTTLLDHYVALVDERDGKAYFKIRPTPPRVIKFRKEAVS